MKRITSIGALAGLMVTGGLLTAPAASATQAEHQQFAPSVSFAAEDAGASCTVSGGTMSWGVKESFRSYISSTIANGSWEVSEGATYETPLFGWSGATGAFDPADATGNVSFLGAITFTGHGGILNMVMANPTIEFAADSTARLLIDVRSNDTSGALVIDEQQTELGALSISAPIVAETGTTTLSDVAVTLTEAGVPAFGDFYQAGAALDPLTVSFDLDCVAAVSNEADDEKSDKEEVVIMPISTETEGSEFPWLPVGIGAAAVVVIGAATGLVLAKRRKNAPSESVE